MIRELNHQIKSYFTGLTKQNIHIVSIHIQHITATCESSLRSCYMTHFLVLKLYTLEGYKVLTKRFS